MSARVIEGLGLELRTVEEFVRDLQSLSPLAVFPDLPPDLARRAAGTWTSRVSRRGGASVARDIRSNLMAHGVNPDPLSQD